MQVTVEMGEGLERRMRIDIPPERIQGTVDSRLKQIARTVRLPGFRPGKVPMKLIQQRFGNQVELEVFTDLVQTSFTEAVTAEALRVVGTPKIEPGFEPAKKHYGFTATFEVLPEIELAPLTGKVVKRPVSEIKDADLETVIERLREQRKTWVQVQRPAQTGDRLTASFTGTMDGETFEGGTASSVQVVLGSGGMIPGFEDGLIGAAAGETRHLDLNFPEVYPRAELAGKPVRFEVSIEAVEEPELPAIDEDFVRALGVEDGDIGRFRTEVRANMERELQERIKARTKEAVMDVLAEVNPVAIPKAMLADELQGLKMRMLQSMGVPNMDLPDDLFAEPARRRVALGLIVSHLIKQQGFKAEPAQVRSAIETLASTYDEPKQVIDYYYADRKRLAPVESMVLEEQVVDWVLSQVTVEDEEIAFADLTDPMAAAKALA
jgi:trigger factor